jgi:E3 ubiquitin-protein ligase mind-bomb
LNRVQLGPREGCTKIPLKGIFIGAKVIRGPDWEWGNQDGGRGIYVFFKFKLVY